MIEANGLKSYMERNGISKRAFIAEMDASNSLFERIYTGDISLSSVDKICSRLKCQPSDLWEFKYDRH